MSKGRCAAKAVLVNGPDGEVKVRFATHKLWHIHGDVVTPIGHVSQLPTTGTVVVTQRGVKAADLAAILVPHSRDRWFYANTHPATGTENAFRRVAAACCDPERREAYDKLLALGSLSTTNRALLSAEGIEAGDPATPPDRLHQLAGTTSTEVKMVLATNPAISPETVQVLIQKSTSLVLRGLLENPNTPTEVFQQLAESPEMAHYVAAHSKTPPDVLEYLAEDELNDAAREAAANNVNTPSEALRKLVSDPEWAIGAAALTNPSIPTAFLVEAATYGDEDMRLQAAANEALPRETLQALFHDESLDVVGSAITNPLTTADDLTELAASTRDLQYYLAKSPNATVELLDSLAMSTRVEVRRAVAYHSRTAPSTLDMLAKSLQTRTRRAVAGNVNAAPGTLARLAVDDDETIASAAKVNPSTPSRFRMLGPATHLPILLAELVAHSSPVLPYATMEYAVGMAKTWEGTFPELVAMLVPTVDQ